MPMGAGTRYYERTPGRYMRTGAGTSTPDPALPPGQNFANREAFLQYQQSIHDQARQAYADKWGSDEGWAQFDPTRGTFKPWERGAERHQARTGARDAYYDYMLRQGGAGQGPVDPAAAMEYAMTQIGAPPGTGVTLPPDPVADATATPAVDPYAMAQSGDLAGALQAAQAQGMQVPPMAGGGKGGPGGAPPNIAGQSMGEGFAQGQGGKGGGGAGQAPMMRQGGARVFR